MLKEKSQVSAVAPCSPPTAPPRMLLLQESSRLLSNWEGDPEWLTQPLGFPMAAHRFLSLLLTPLPPPSHPQLQYRPVCCLAVAGVGGETRVGLSAQQPPAGHLARLQGKAPGAEGEEGSKGMGAAPSPVAGLVSALRDTVPMQGSCVSCSPFCQAFKVQQPCPRCLKASPGVGSGELPSAGPQHSGSCSDGEQCCVLERSSSGACLLEGDFGQATKATVLSSS